MKHPLKSWRNRNRTQAGVLSTSEKTFEAQPVKDPMKTHSSWKKYAAILTCLCFCAAIEAYAQMRPTSGFGSSGGSSGFGGGRSGGMGGMGGSSGAGNQYNPNGSVGSATISMDSDTRSITVIADEETMKTVTQVISTLDKPRPQVLIKVVFLELQHSDDSDIGIEGGVKIGNSFAGVNGFGLSALSTGAGSNNFLGQPLSSFQQIAPYAAGPGAGLYQVLGKDFQATLRAIAQAGKATLLSRPSVLSRDGQPATVVVGQSVPLVTSVSYSSSGLTSFPIVNISYQNVGIILKVTPFIASGGMVQMIVSPTISSVDPSLSQTIAVSPGGGSPVTAPYLDLRQADTVVVTPDAQPVVIGGMIQHDKNTTDIKIPVLGDIPWLGALFKRTVKTDDKNELLIFLTPHIVQAPTALTAMADKERIQLVPPKSDSEEMLDRFLDRMPVKKQKSDGKSQPAKP